MFKALTLSGLLFAASAWCDASSKRGLVYVQSDFPEDDKVWYQPGSDLTWYYNYGSVPSIEFADSNLDFVPMLWGSPEISSDTTFLDSVTSQLEAGANFTYVLGFNEPDGTWETGGSNIAPEVAAAAWIKQIEPLKEKGLKLGAPAVTGSPRGSEWLENFFKECAGQCNVDFIPTHWYGPFEGFASRLGEVRAAYPNQTIWVTEYALAHEDLAASQSFYNSTAEYLDRLDYVTHYSWFGSFRSDNSSVGVNAAMLTEDGAITDIGAWYLNIPAEGNVPSSAPTLGSSTGTRALLVLAAVLAVMLRS
ncbi:MAG: hypothetical protein M1833_004755 [Piccolia ochrophora]|nr:MAG: hypothetical protein M1833_004755 [Piccolia ochrophora]